MSQIVSTDSTVEGIEHDPRSSSLELGTARPPSFSDPLASLSHRDDSGIKWVALALAVAIHVGFMFVNFPEIKQAIQPKPKKTILVVRKYIPPPPRIERRQSAPSKHRTRKIPIPDPTPEAPEPIREPAPVLVPEPLPQDVEILIGVPGPPPPSDGPVLAGVGDVSSPELIEETKVCPEYPELARVARMEGDVILQAVIHRNGTVGELDVLRCTQPSVGFEDAAIAAVRQWRYTPAKQNGRPVDVYFTVLVEFELL